MGKRKERRLAAMSAAGRRVKLDLFAEPSGEMVSNSLHDEVGGDLDQDHRAGVPTLPSSSGQKQENPLLLLGQYSDDEQSEEASTSPTSTSPTHVVGEISSTDPDSQVEEHVDAGENKGSNTVEAIIAGGIKQETDQLDAVKNLVGNDVRESGIPDAVSENNETDPVTQVCVPEVSGMQIIGDASGGWKVVMDEQSSQHYYWNTVTGETSWEVPNGLAQGTEITDQHNISAVAEDRVDALVDEHASIPHSNTDPMPHPTDGLGGSDLISKSSEEYRDLPEMGRGNEEINLAYDGNETLTTYTTSAIGISHGESSALPDFCSLQQSNSALSESLTTSAEDYYVSDYEVKDKNLSQSYETTDIHSSRLVKYGETLLQKLKAIERPGNHIEGHEWIVKEVEIRLSDCKALSSFGSSLLPFWWHTETQLRQLESAISKEEEASQLGQAKHHNEVEDGKVSSWSDESSLLQSRGSEPAVAEKNKVTSLTVDNVSTLPSSDVSKEAGVEVSSHMPDSEEAKRGERSSGFQHLGSELVEEVAIEAHQNLVSANLTYMIESHAGEDVDMDVEMEVDEESPASHNVARDSATTECPAPSEQSIPPNLPSLECPSVCLDEFSVPPPPDEEWIPPPPPDSELVPPPPPEEPPVPSFPPPYSETVPSYPYMEQYNLGYPVQTYEYYPPSTAEATNVTYYAHAEGCHITEPQPPPYYEPVVAIAFPEAAPDVGNPVEPIVYYDIPSVTVPPAPVISSVESSGFYVESVPSIYHDNASLSDHTWSAGLVMESGSNSLANPKVESDFSTVSSETERENVQVASISATSQAAGTALVNGSAVNAPLLAAPKNQPKVVRNKKRTIAVAPTLRSNKKVSSLVDKWKAAKEELHGDEEEEPEDPYEILEKKRKKEIEQWRARQIASGEAQDNANFLPLGSDWRERVKRKKLASNTEAVQTPSGANEKKQPDLIELSKDLPSGWQAYWDESSKEVYFGNTITSETTWTRPTR